MTADTPTSGAPKDERQTLAAEIADSEQFASDILALRSRVDGLRHIYDPDQLKVLHDNVKYLSWLVTVFAEDARRRMRA